MLDSDQERPSILVLRLHSGSVGPASRVDFGQFYKIIQYIISYMYMYMYYNQSSMSPSWKLVASFWKIVLCGLKMGAEHSSIKKVI